MQSRHTKVREETKIHSKGKKKKAKDLWDGRRHADGGNVDPQENGDSLNNLPHYDEVWDKLRQEK